MDVLHDFVGGEKVEARIVEGASLFSPNDGTVLGPMRESEPATLERALEMASRAHLEGWLADRDARSRWLRSIGQRLATRVPRLAEVEAEATGVVRRTTDRLARLVPVIFEKAAALLEQSRPSLEGPHGPLEISRRALGPAVCLAPWNAPAPIAAHKVASAIAAGCPVILKPSEWAPHGVQVIADAIFEAGLPPGAFQLVHGRGDIGRRLVGDARVRAVSFTGGLEGGLSVARACAEGLKPVQLELGGNNALVVLESADLALATEGVVTALTTLNGQWCRALGRLLVHERLYDALLVRVEERMRTLVVGDSRRLETEFGPVIHGGHRDHLRAEVARLVERGGVARTLVPVPDGAGTFFSPTLVTGCDPSDTLDEIFGPVAAVHGFANESEALRLASAPPYGLASYVFGDEEAAFAFARGLECGATQINGVSMTALHPDAPRAAWRRSGLGAEGTRETFEFFTGTTVIGVAGIRR